MLVEIDSSRYAKIARSRALAILERADLKPDRFTAHRDRSFTAKYLRDKQPLFTSHRYEERIEIAADNSVAIFKRPNKRTDRGRYITLKFAVAALDDLGLPKVKLTADGTALNNGAAKTKTSPKRKKAVKEVVTVEKVVPVSADTSLKPLASLAGDLKHLLHYARELVEKLEAATLDSQRKTILSTLGEAQKQGDALAAGLGALAADAQ
jgi:hypothetical protein